MNSAIALVIVAILVVNVFLVADLWRRSLSPRYARILVTWFRSPPPHRHYAIIDLGDLAGHGSFAYAINSSDQVVGYAYLFDGTAMHAVMWQKGNITDLGTLPDTTDSVALGINDVGQVVGWSGANPYGSSRGFLWDGGAMSDIGVLVGDKDSRATAINASGQIVANSYTAGTSTAARPFVYHNKVVVPLSSFGSAGAVANGINTTGQVVGGAYAMPSIWHAFMYTSPVIADLGTVAGSWSDAKAINDLGAVVGSSSDASNQGTGTAFLYASGTMKDLGTLGGDRAYAMGVNNNGVVIGSAENGDSEPWGSPAVRAFVSTGRGMWDLNDLIPAGSDWKLEVANGINQADHIVGWGHMNAGKTIHAFLLTPID